MLRNISILVIAALVLTGCADAVPLAETVKSTDLYGFWYGLWHGMIVPFAFIGSLFSDDIAIYATNNTGGWYDFGFALGIGAFSSASAASR